MKPITKLIFSFICLAAAFFIFYRYSFKKTEPPKLKESYFYCEPCDKEFLSASGTPTAKCPTCGATTTIYSFRKRCKKCGHEFTQFQLDTSTNMTRFPGGTWNSGFSSYRPCPECGNEDLLSLPPDEEVSGGHN